MRPFDDYWPYEEFNGDYIAFLNSMSKQERIAWRKQIDKERLNDMARGRPAKAKASAQASQLAEALAFVEVAMKDDKAAQDYQQHVNLSGKMAIAFNGQVSAGHPISEELNLCPHLSRLQVAIARCGNSLVIAETPTGQLSIKGEKLKALVPCLPIEEMPESFPDAQVAVLTEAIREAFKVCGTLASEEGKRVVEASLLLEANSCTGTNGSALMQYWHGIDLPPAMVLPKLFTAAVVKVSKPIVGFGFSWNADCTKVKSVTFWFEGGAWIKTQCYEDAWPSIDHIINHPSHPSPVLAGLFEAIDAVQHFNDDKFVTFAENKVMSHDTTAFGAQYEVKGLQGGLKFDSKLIKMVAPFIKQIDLTTYDNRAFFFGDNVRGVVMGMKALVTEADISANYEPGQTEIDQSPANQGWGSHISGDPTDDYPIDD